MVEALESSPDLERGVVGRSAFGLGVRSRVFCGRVKTKRFTRALQKV